MAISHLVRMANGDLLRSYAVTPGQFVRTMSIILEVPEETVTQHDRNLVMAGLRTKGGRGPSAPHVTHLDAARLLAATIGSVRTKDSAETVGAFERAMLRGAMDWSNIPSMAHIPKRYIPARRAMDWSDISMAHIPKRHIPAMEQLPKRHSFVGALASIIKAVSADEVEAADWLDARISCETPIGRASIILASGKLYSYGPPVKLERQWQENLGIHQERQIYGPTMLLIGLAFRENGLKYATARKAMEAILGAKSSKDEATAGR
jgi:hypothetical protein